MREVLNVGWTLWGGDSGSAWGGGGERERERMGGGERKQMREVRTETNARGEEQKQMREVLNVGWALWRGIRSRLKGEISGWPYTYANTEKGVLEYICAF